VKRLNYSYEFKNEDMRSFRKIISICVILLSFIALHIDAQTQQIDFKFDKTLKASDKIDIHVVITETQGPYTYMIYQGDPLEKGTLLKKDEISLKDFTISYENKSDLYLYISSSSEGKHKSFKIVKL